MPIRIIEQERTRTRKTKDAWQARTKATTKRSRLADRDTQTHTKVIIHLIMEFIMQYWFQNKRYNTMIQALEVAYEVAKATHKHRHDCEFVHNAPETEEDKVEVAFVYKDEVKPTVMTFTEDLPKIDAFNDSIQPYSSRSAPGELNAWCK